MKTYLLILILFSVNYCALGQYYPNKGALFEARIKTTDGKVNKVNLFALTDSAIFVTDKSLNPSDMSTHDYTTNLKIPVKNIKHIKFRIKGASRQGFLLGFLVGIIAPISYYLEAMGQEEEVKIEESIYVGISFAVTSTLIGGALGSKYAHYPIRCDYEVFKVLRPELEYYTIINNYIYE